MKNIDIKSLMDISFLSSPLLSPDGKRTAYVVSKQNYKENSYESWLHLLDNESGETRQLTFAGKESGFVWEDAHTLLFAAERAEADKPEKFQEKTVFYRLDIRGGEACKAFAIDKNVNSLKPLGGGKYLVNATIDLNRPADDMDETLRGDEKDYHVLEEVPFWANGRGYISRLRSALYIYDAADGSLKKITDDYFNVRDFDVKNGLIIYAGQAYEEKVSIYGEARLYDIASGETTVIVGPKDELSVGGVFLTEKTAILGLSTLKPWGTGQYDDFYRYDLAAKTLKLVKKMDFLAAPDVLFDCSYGGGQTARVLGEELYFIGQQGYNTEVYKLTEANEVEKVIPFEGAILSLDLDGAHTVFGAHAANRCGDLYALENGAPVKKTDINGAYFAEHYVAEAKYIPFTDSDGVKIDGWVLLPQDFDPNKSYPAVLEVHGGPRCAFGTVFYHELQALAGAGYVVMFCNPRGSEGYGEQFADLRGKYGTIDYQDLMEFVDHVLALYPNIDKKRLGETGGSYGGFMSNWIVGHTDRFAAIASQRSISNWVADFGSSEIGFTFDQNEMGATPWTDMEKMWEQSPLKYAHNAKTPILFIHSLCDYNCTLDQGVEMFAAMKYFGVPSRMVLFEGENHSLSRSGKPRHRIRRLEEIFGWFEKYLKA